DCHSVIPRDSLHTLVVGDLPSPPPISQVTAHLAPSCYRAQLVDVVDPLSLKSFEEGDVAQRPRRGEAAPAQRSGGRRRRRCRARREGGGGLPPPQRRTPTRLRS